MVLFHQAIEQERTAPAERMNIANVTRDANNTPAFPANDPTVHFVNQTVILQAFPASPIAVENGEKENDCPITPQKSPHLLQVLKRSHEKIAIELFYESLNF